MTDMGGLTQGYLDEWFPDNGAFATFVGAEGYDHLLGDFSAASFERRERRSRHWLGTFAGLTDAELSRDDQMDRDVMLAHLRGEVVKAELPVWRRDPGMYLIHCLFGVSLLFWHRLHPDPELVAAINKALGIAPRPPTAPGRTAMKAVVYQGKRDVAVTDVPVEQPDAPAAPEAPETPTATEAPAALPATEVAPSTRGARQHSEPAS